MDDSINTSSPSKKKHKANISFETSTPIVAEPEKSSSKKKKKKDKDNEKCASEVDIRETLISQIISKTSKPKKKSK